MGDEASYAPSTVARELWRETLAHGPSHRSLGRSMRRLGHGSSLLPTSECMRETSAEDPTKKENGGAGCASAHAVNAAPMSYQ